MRCRHRAQRGDIGAGGMPMTPAALHIGFQGAQLSMGWANTAPLWAATLIVRLIRAAKSSPLDDAIGQAQRLHAGDRHASGRVVAPWRGVAGTNVLLSCSGPAPKGAQRDAGEGGAGDGMKVFFCASDIGRWWGIIISSRRGDDYRYEGRAARVVENRRE